MKPQRVPSLVSIAILTTITIIFWILFSVYRVLTAKPAPDIPPKILESITPSLDEATVSRIEKSVFFQESQIVTPTTTLTPAPAASPTSTPVASPSAIATPSASPSGTPKGG